MNSGDDTDGEGLFSLPELDTSRARARVRTTQSSSTDVRESHTSDAVDPLRLRAAGSWAWWTFALGTGAVVGGIALGADRMLMLLCRTPSIRDVIAFPKTQRQTDMMLDAPANIDIGQMLELGLRRAPSAS